MKFFILVATLALTACGVRVVQMYDSHRYGAAERGEAPAETPAEAPAPAEKGEDKGDKGEDGDDD